MDWETESNFDFENEDELRDELRKLFTPNKTPDASMVDVKIFSKALKFKSWLEKNCDVEPEMSMHEIGLRNWLSVSFTTEDWGTTLKQKIEFKSHFEAVDQISVSARNDGTATVSFAYNGIIKHFSKPN